MICRPRLVEGIPEDKCFIVISAAGGSEGERRRKEADFIVGADLMDSICLHGKFKS